MNLKEKLEDQYNRFSNSAPDNIKSAFARAADELMELEIEKNALKVGDIFPEFKLKNAVGKEILSRELLLEGNLIISFYRGGWWPYCNIELGSYQERLEEIKNLNTQFIAISPEFPDQSMSVQEKNELEFEILSDIDNILAKKLGIVFSLNNELIDLYKGFGIDLPKTQGNNRQELPVPATYLVDSNGIIVVADIDTDYTKRLEPQAIIDVLKKLDM